MLKNLSDIQIAVFPRVGIREVRQASFMLHGGVAQAFAGGDLVTCELGGEAWTDKVFSAVEAQLDSLDV